MSQSELTTQLLLGSHKFMVLHKAWFELGSLGPQAIVLPTEPNLLVIRQNKQKCLIDDYLRYYLELRQVTNKRHLCLAGEKEFC